MKKNLTWFALVLFALFTFNACSDDENPTNPDDSGNGGITSISGTFGNWALGDGYTIKLLVEAKNEFVAGSASINSSGSFKIDNLKDVPADYLDTMDEIPEGINVSNPNVKISDSYLAVYNNSGIYAGSAYYEGMTGNDWFEVDYTYVNGDVNITGSGTDDFGGMPVPINASLYFKKGWNKFYTIYSTNDTSYTIKMTTESPGTAEWVFSGGKTDAATKSRPKATMNIFK